MPVPANFDLNNIEKKSLPKENRPEFVTLMKKLQICMVKIIDLKN
jgi:hypothetical protein